MKSISISFSLIILLHSGIQAQTNDTALARMISNVRSLYELNPNEKCFLHTDKQFYQPGENIWLKTYLTVNDLPSLLSAVVYTDFSDVNGKLYSKQMWHVKDHHATGSIFIPDTLATGIYRIRAYTLWMLNNPGSISEQYVFILGKSDQSKSFYVPSTEFTVNFFPEGGKLIEAAENNLAFTIADANKLPALDVKIELLDEAQKKIADPVVYSNGTGLIRFTPEPDKTYSLQVSLNLNNKKKFPLPATSKSGMVLNVSNLSATKISVQANAASSFMDANKQINVIAQQYGKTVFVQQFNFDEGQTAAVINKKTLADGLMQVLAINNKQEIVAERWIWVQQPTTAELTLTADSVSFDKKGKNKFTLTVNSADIPDLSVSVIPADLPSYSFLSHPTIKSYQLLHSNKQAKQSFVQNSINVPAELSATYLDALLLTVQPGRFTHEQLATSKQPALNYFFETGISIRGSVEKDRESMQFDSSKIDIITKGADSSTIFSTAKLDNKGNFAVNDLYFRKQATVYLQATTKEKRKRKLEFKLLPGYLDTLGDRTNAAFFSPVLKELPPAQTKSEDFVKYYSVPKLGKELAEIIIKGKNKEERQLDSLNKVLASDLFRDAEFTKIPNPNFGYISFAQLFEQEFFGFRFNNGYAKIGGLDGSPASGLAGSDMISYYLNEQPISAEELGFINPAEVVMVKVNRSINLHLGQMGPGPSVLIYTVRKQRSRFGFDASSLTGYSIPLSFVYPDYSNAEARANEDRRTTLLWQPQVNFSNGKATIRFYNNDYSKKYKVIVQGIDKKGNLYYLEKIIE